VERRLVALLGTTAKHMLGGLQRALRAVLLTGLITAIVVAGITEVIGYFLSDRQFPPGGPTHLAAAALAIAFAYAAAITVAIEEILRAIIKSVELIVHEAEQLEKKAAEEIGVLARRAEEEGIRFGRAAVTDAGALGRTALSDAGAVGRAVAGGAGAVVGGVEREVRGVEHGIGSHLPGHHHADAPMVNATVPNGPADTGAR